MLVQPPQIVLLVQLQIIEHSQRMYVIAIQATMMTVLQLLVNNVTHHVRHAQGAQVQIA